MLDNKCQRYNTDQGDLVEHLEAYITDLREDLQNARDALRRISVEICGDDGVPPPDVIAEMAIEMFRRAKRA